MIALRCAYRPKKARPDPARFTNGAGEGEDGEAQGMRRGRRKPACAPASQPWAGPRSHEKDYVDRLAFELDVIHRMKYPGYFLIVADFI